MKEKNTKEARIEYKKNTQKAKRVISSAKKKKQKECADDLNDSGEIVSVKMKYVEWQSRWLKKDRI